MKIISMIAELQKRQTGKIESYEPRSAVVEEIRNQVASKHTGNFPIFNGLTYEAKTDRYVAAFSGFESLGGKKMTFKCSAPVMSFLLANHEVRQGHWYLTLNDAGLLVDVDILAYD